jgi:hypothetical protein
MNAAASFGWRWARRAAILLLAAVAPAARGDGLDALSLHAEVVGASERGPILIRLTLKNGGRDSIQARSTVGSEATAVFGPAAGLKPREQRAGPRSEAVDRELRPGATWETLVDLYLAYESVPAGTYTATCTWSIQAVVGRPSTDVARPRVVHRLTRELKVEVQSDSKAGEKSAAALVDWLNVPPTDDAKIAFVLRTVEQSRDPMMEPAALELAWRFDRCAAPVAAWYFRTVPSDRIASVVPTRLLAHHRHHADVWLNQWRVAGRKPPTAAELAALAGSCNRATRFATFIHFHDQLDPGTRESILHEAAAMRSPVRSTWTKPLLRQLAAGDFRSRELAAIELQTAGDRVLSELRQAARKPATADEGERLNKLIAAIEKDAKADRTEVRFVDAALRHVRDTRGAVLLLGAFARNAPESAVAVRAREGLAEANAK